MCCDSQAMINSSASKDELFVTRLCSPSSFEEKPLSTKRARSKSFSSLDRPVFKIGSADKVGGKGAHENNSSILSSYGEAASENEISDSRFNDISCISYIATDDKDVSRIDVCSVAAAPGADPNNLTINTSHSSASETISTPIKSLTNESSTSGNNKSNGTAGSKRKFATATNTSATNTLSQSAKRMKRDSMRLATDGPLARPILRERDLPPDRYHVATEV